VSRAEIAQRRLDDAWFFLILHLECQHLSVGAHLISYHPLIPPQNMPVYQFLQMLGQAARLDDLELGCVFLLALLNLLGVLFLKLICNTKTPWDSPR